MYVPTRLTLDSSAKLPASTLQDSLSAVDAISTHVGSRCSTRWTKASYSEVTTGLPAKEVAATCDQIERLPREVEHLVRFGHSLMQPLEAASSLMAESDADLAHYLSGICSQAHEWMDHAGETLTDIVRNAREMRRSMLPSLRSAEEKSKHHAASSLLGAAKDVMGNMSGDAKDVLVTFISLRNNVHYLIDCTQVELDSRTADTAGQDAFAARTASLRAALALLDKALAAMDPESPFWQRFYCIGKQLAEMTDVAQELRSSLCSISRGERFPQGFADFCAATEGFCAAQHAAAGEL